MTLQEQESMTCGMTDRFQPGTDVTLSDRDELLVAAQRNLNRVRDTWEDVDWDDDPSREDLSEMCVELSHTRFLLNEAGVDGVEEMDDALTQLRAYLGDNDYEGKIERMQVRSYVWEATRVTPAEEL